METYDSTKDTKDHIARVQMLLVWCAQELHRRGLAHDKSKLESPEKEIFDEVTPRLKGLTYGSPEYKQSLADMGPALTHHYQKNSHHPEHHENGMSGFDLFDLIEAFVDWKAAGDRHENGNLLTSIKINASRFDMPPMLVSIMNNTVERYPGLLSKGKL